jgi:hypothetical protein
MNTPGAGGSRLLVPILVLMFGVLVLCGSAGAVVVRAGSTRFGPSQPATLADVCSLVPGDLLGRLVPGATPEDKKVLASRLRATKTCRAGTSYRRPVTASLRVEVSRYGRYLDYPPPEHAKRDFIARKNVHSKVSTNSVFDVAGLGQSAFLEVDPYPSGATVQASVYVLRGDVLISVEYSASPSSGDLVTAAAVAVSRRVMEKL